MVGVEFCAASEVESGITGLGQYCRVLRGVIILGESHLASVGCRVIQGTYLDIHEVVRGHIEDSQAHIVEALQPSLSGVIRDSHGDDVPYGNVSRFPSLGHM